MELQIIKRETTGSGTVEIMQINVREKNKKFVCFTLQMYERQREVYKKSFSFQETDFQRTFYRSI